MDLPKKFLNLEFFTNWKASGGSKPLITKRMVPKLLKQGLKKSTLAHLSASQKMELMCLFARVLYNTGA